MSWRPFGVFRAEALPTPLFYVANGLDGKG